MPLGLGQVFERLESALAEWLLDTPFLEWLPVRDIELQPLVPGGRTGLRGPGRVDSLPAGLFDHPLGRRGAPCLPSPPSAVGRCATALSAALSWGPSHAWAWLSLPVRLGLLVGLVLALVLLPVPRRGCAALVLLALVCTSAC